MASLFQHFAAALIGLALAVYGLLHAAHVYPDPKTWSRMAEAMPTLASVMLFVLGVAIAVAGLLLTVLSARRLRRRWQTRPAAGGVRREPDRYASASHNDPREQEEPDYHDDAYRFDSPYARNVGPNGRAGGGGYRS